MNKRIRPERIYNFIKTNFTYVIMLIATFFALSLIVMMTFGSFYSSIKKNAITIGNMTVTEEARRIDDSLKLGLNTLQMVSFSIDYMLERGDSEEEMHRFLVRESEDAKKCIDPGFTSFYGVVNDTYIDGVNWEPPEGYDPYTRPWYIAAAEKKGELAIVSPYIDAQTHSIMISFSRILSDGVSAVSLDKEMDDIYSVAQTIQLNGKGYCFVVDDNGMVVAHRDGDEVGKNYLTDADAQGSDMQNLIKAVYSTDENVMDTELGGRDCMVFAESIQDEWYVVLVVNDADLFKDIRVSLVRNIFISLVIFILVGYFCTSNYFNRKKAIRYADDIRTDDLTGLNNRGEFDRYLNATISKTANGRRLYLMLFDADGFKTINDRYGHTEGDNALRYIAEALKSVCHGTDWFCARYGGDEFVIVCKCYNDDEVRKIISDIAERLDEKVLMNKLPYRLSLSCGFSEHKPDKQTITELIDIADQTLYQVKAEKKKQSAGMSL